MVKTIGDLFTAKEKVVLDEIMPGGEKWHDLVDNEDGDCKPTCPSYTKSTCGGPGQICDKKNNRPLWNSLKPTNRKLFAALRVLIHVFENFEHYSHGDILYEGNEKCIKGILRKANNFYYSLFNKKIGKEAVTKSISRINQFEFRRALIFKWNGCAITKITNEDFLVASHIKPWSKASARGKVYPSNGLLLSPSLDFLFDRGYISFKNNGTVLIKPEYKKECKILGVNKSMKIKQLLDNRHKKNLEWHRKHHGFQ